VVGYLADSKKQRTASMRVSTLIIALSSVLLLANFAGCGFRPSRGPVLKPAGLEKAPETEVSDGLAWTKLDGYDAAHPSLPANGPVKKLNLPVVYEEATVFPVDGDATPYEDGKYDFTKPIERLPAVVSDDGVAGGVSQQVFFGNGSAKLRPRIFFRPPMIIRSGWSVMPARARPDSRRPIWRWRRNAPMTWPPSCKRTA
jgi:hypothetical protein